LAGPLVELDWSGAAGVLDGLGEVVAQPGVLERVGVAAFGQEPDASDRQQDEPVQEPVGDLVDGCVAAQFQRGDVADDRDVGVG